ncbi:hypothetical protein ACFE04_009036 [Oxalis oulophora]
MTNFMAKAISLLFISMVITSPLAQSAISCSQVAAAVAPCVNYCIVGGPTVPVSCCRGLGGLLNEAKTRPDIQQTCRCMKSIASNFPAVKEENAAQIPPKCGIKSPFKISLSTDCNRV